MTRLRLALTLGPLLLAAQPLPPAQGVAITGITIIDVETGSRFPDRTVLINGLRITAVGAASQLAPPANARTVDGKGKFLIPGLWDMHVHTLPQATRPRALETFLPLFVANGVTAVRDMGSVLSTLGAEREQIGRSRVPVPRVIASGAMLDGPRPIVPGISIPIADETDARRAVEALRSTGADFVKVYSTLSRDGYFAIIAFARDNGLPVAGHVPFSLSAAEASDAGQRSIEHLAEINIACSSEEASLRRDLVAAVESPDTTFASVASVRQAARSAAAKTFDAPRCRDLFARFKRNGTWVVPTLSVDYNANDPSRSTDPRLRYFERETIANWNADPRRASDARDGQLSPIAALDSTGALRTVRDLAAAGVGLLAGTDLTNQFTFPGFDIHLELSLFVAAGLTPLHALQTATINPVRFLNATGVRGTVAAGKFADLVILDANPLIDIRNTAKIHAVVANGRLFTRSDLDAVLTAVESVAKTPN